MARGARIIPLPASERSREIAIEGDKRQIEITFESTLTGRQRQTMQARAALLQYCDAKAVTGLSMLAAYEATAREANAGLLPAHLQSLVPVANDRSGGSARLSARTLRRWAADRKKAGVAGVAPSKTREREPAPAWMDAFLSYYARPMKPSIADAMRQWQEDHPEATLPSYSAVRAALDKLSHMERARGREGRLALKARQAYVKRDTSDLLPGSVYAADGTTWDREVEHPIHGRPFKPEITAIIDAHTRMCVGWSAGLAEGWQGTIDALRHACSACIPAIFYSDRGSGYVNERMDCEITGFLARLGVTPMRALPYHSWAKGNVEAFQKQWITLAKRAPTFTGAGMDKEAKQLVFKTTRRDIALVGASRLLTSWGDFLGEVADFIGKYNARPHRGLPRMRDAETGVKRHLSPNEMWAKAIAERGFEAMVPTPEEMDDLFRPYEIRTARRCCVQLGTNSYFDLALDPFHEQEVMVGYDMRDATRVWVREIDKTKDGRIPGRLICVARFEGNSQRYVPVSMEQRAMEKRALGRKRRLEGHLSVVEAELRPGVTLDPANAPHLEIPAPVSFSASPARDSESSQEEAASPARSVVSEEVERFAAVGEAVSNSGRPAFVDDAAFARWIVAHGAEATETDRAYAAELINDRTTREMLRIKGVDIVALQAIAVRRDA
ncbi:Mu transposase C-terminal domain-containing protein [Methylocystis sp. S23]